VDVLVEIAYNQKDGLGEGKSMKKANRRRTFWLVTAVIGLMAALTGCRGASKNPTTEASGNGSSASASSPEASTSAGSSSITLQVTGAYTADRKVASSAADPQAVLCQKAGSIFSVLHSGDAPSGDGNLGSFAIGTQKFHGNGTYSFDDGSASFAFVDIKEGKGFSEDSSSSSATKTGELTIKSEGKSGSFKITFGPGGGDPPTDAPVEVTGTFSCGDLVGE
jgi:hypothetical protein